jgi:MATE family multidrug resistance protein
VLRGELKPTLRLAVPVILAELGWMAMGVVDTIMVGPLGPAAIGATGIGNSLHFGFAVFGMGLLLGLDTLVSQAYGARDHVLCRRWLARGVQLALLTTIPLMVVLVAVLMAIPLFGIHPDTRPLLRGYFSVLTLSTPFLLLYAAFRRYLQSTHHVGPVLFALTSANLINGVANWALIYGHLGMPALGVQGAAWATTAARGYMFAVLAIAVWWTNRHEATLTKEDHGGLPSSGDGAAAAHDPQAALPPRRAADGAPRVALLGQRPTSVRRLVELGFPAASTVMAEVGAFALSMAFAGRLEPVATASHQISMSIAAVAFMIPLGLASAGAVWTVIAMGVTFMLISGTLFLLVPRTLIGFFTRDAGVLTLGTSLLAIAAVFQLFDGLQGVVTGTLRGLGDTRTPMVTNLGAHWLVGLPIGYTLCFVAGWGAPGLWWGLSVGLIVAGVVLLAAWIRRTGQLRGGRLRP